MTKLKEIEISGMPDVRLDIALQELNSIESSAESIKILLDDVMNKIRSCKEYVKGVNERLIEIDGI